MANHQAGRISVGDSEPESGECIRCNSRNYLQIKMNSNQQLSDITHVSRRSEQAKCRRCSGFSTLDPIDPHRPEPRSGN